MFTLTYRQKKRISLGGRVGLGGFFLVLGIILLVSGLTQLVIEPAEIPKTTNEKITETKNISGYPELFWLPSYDVFVEPRDSKFLESGSKIKLRVVVGTSKLIDSFFVYVFHEDLSEKYDKFLVNYLGDGTMIPKLKTEWESYADFTTDPMKCTKIINATHSEIIRDCSYDYNATIIGTFEHSGKYNILFISKYLTDELGYPEPGSIFSLRDSLTVEIKEGIEESIETVLMINDIQQKLNYQAQALSLIGIGVAMLIGAIALFDSFVNAKRQYSIFEKDNEKRIYIEKMLVTALARTREQTRLINTRLLADKAVTTRVIESWGRLKLPAERIDTLILMGSDSVNHQILDDADMVKGTISGEPRDTPQGLVDQLGQIESLINALIGGELNSSRTSLLTESLANITRQREEHLSKGSVSQNQDEIKLMLDSQENITRRLYNV